jgi:outer membrane protein OmpA-like peptidoglycan-associated protein
MLLALISVLFPCLAFSGTELVGTTSSNFIKIPPFARAAGMGEAFTAVADGTCGIYYNPAGITSVLGYEAQFSHISWFQNINYEFLSLVTPFPVTDVGKLGLAFAWFQIDPLTRTTALPSYAPSDLETVDYSSFNEKFSPYDYSVILAYALDIKENFSGGVSIKMISQNIDKYSGANVTADIGFIYKAFFAGTYSRLAVDMTNLGSDLKMHDISFEPPKVFKAGLSNQLPMWNGTMLIAAQALVQADYDPLYSLGFEYWIFDMVALRFGYKLGAFTQPTYGAGFRYNGMEIDYAYVKYDELGDTHRVSLLYSWGTPPVKLKAYPYVFSPNNDRFIDYTYLTPVIKCPEKLKSMKVNIYTGDSKTLLGSIPVADKTLRRISWNGSVNETILPDGVYQASITAEYNNGSSESNRVPVEIDNTPPSMTIDADPKLLKPGQNDSLIVPATFTFFAKDKNKVAKWQFAIWDYNKKLFFSTGGSGEPPLSYIWDGKGVDNQYIKTGELYYYSLITYDSVGNKAQTKPEAVVILLKEIKLSFSSDALFDLGQADVKISAYSVLKTIKDTINQYPDSDIQVNGYTDNIQPKGIKYKDNTELSKARAEAVKFFMVNLLGYDESRIKTEGFGELYPIADNLTEEGRLKNRRVEIVIKSTYYK